jgi:hypothetical protein
MYTHTYIYNENAEIGMNDRGLETQTSVTYSVGEEVEGLYENGKATLLYLYIHICIDMCI